MRIRWPFTVYGATGRGSPQAYERATYFGAEFRGTLCIAADVGERSCSTRISSRLGSNGVCEIWSRWPKLTRYSEMALNMGRIFECGHGWWECEMEFVMVW